LLTFTRDQGADKPFTKQINEALDASANLKLDEVKGALAKAFKIKSQPELKNLESASKLLQELFKELEDKVLDVIDEGTQVKQSELSAKIENMLENDRKLKDLAKKVNAVAELLQLPTSVLIQSGSGIDINKVNLETRPVMLSQDTIVFNISAKYMDICAMVARTIMVNPSKEQKLAYTSCLQAVEAIIKNLVPGTRLNKVFEAAKEAVDPKFRDSFPQLIGYGIGNSVKEEGLNISALNDTKVQAGMTFHVRVGLTKIEGSENRRTVLLGDTVVVTQEGAKLLTKNIHRKYGEVSYSLGDKEEEKKPQKAAKP